MIRRAIIIKFLIFSFVLFFTFNWALDSIDEPRLGTVVETTVEVFSQPDFTSEKIAKVDKSDKVIVIDETADWCQVIIADSLYREGWILKRALLTQKLEGELSGANLETMKAFQKKFFGDDIHFWVSLYKYNADRQPINSLFVQSIRIYDRHFLIIDYPFPEIPSEEEYTFSYSPILFLEWKDKQLIPRNFFKHLEFTGVVDCFGYFDSQEAKVVKRHFIVAEIYQNFFEDYETAIKKYQKFAQLFQNSFYESGLLGDPWYKGNARATSYRRIAHLYCKLGDTRKAIEYLYQIIKLYPNEKIFFSEGWEYIDLMAAVGILKIRGLNFPNYWMIRIGIDEFPCTLKDDGTLEECERILATSNSEWIKNLGILGIIQYHLNNLEFPIDIYMKLLKDYPDLCIRNAMEGDYYPILLALNFMCEFLKKTQKYDQAALLIYKSIQALPIDVFVPSMYNGEPKISCADYLYKSIEKRLERIKCHMKYVLARITRASVHLRKQPNLQGKSIGFLDKKEQVVVLESSGNWHHILRYNGEDGWVHDKFIQVTE